MSIGRKKKDTRDKIGVPVAASEWTTGVTNRGKEKGDKYTHTNPPDTYSIDSVDLILEARTVSAQPNK